MTLQQFGERRGIQLSTLIWWRYTFRRDPADIATCGLALFTHDELDFLREMSDEMFRAVHAAKRAFPGSRIVDWL